MRNLILFLTLIITLTSCGNSVDDFKLTPEQLRLRAVSAAGDNNQVITSAEEIVNITGGVLTDAGMPNGRLYRSGNNDRSCNPSIDHSYLIDRTHYDTILYVGTMTIDYGNGETCSNQEPIRKGKVIDNFIYILNTKFDIYSSKETITFEAYKKDSVKLDGELIITSKTGDPVKLETKQAKITYADGTVAVWKGILNFVSHDNDPNTGLAKSKDISGTIEGITRRQESFSAEITTPVEYNYDCSNGPLPMPVSGTVHLNVNQEMSVIEYGNGNCDNLYIISENGENLEHAL